MSSSFDMSRIRKAIADSAGALNKEKGDVARTAARGFVRDVVSITPPASKGTKGAAAKKQGEAAINRDLGKVFTGVQLKHKRKLDHVFSRKLETPIFVPTKEINPDVEGIYNQRIGRKKGRQITRGRRQPWYVDKRKLAKLRASLLKRIGFLAAGWNAAARAMNVKLPAWVARHGDSYGEAKITATATDFRIELSNVVKYVGDVKDYLRRVEYAVNMQAGKLERQADYALHKVLKKAGF